MKKTWVLILGLFIMTAANPAYAVRSGYNLRKKVKGRFVKASKVSNKNYRYIKSTGPYRKVKNIKTGKIYYVWHKAVTKADYKRLAFEKKQLAAMKNIPLPQKKMEDVSPKPLTDTTLVKNKTVDETKAPDNGKDNWAQTIYNKIRGKWDPSNKVKSASTLPIHSQNEESSYREATSPEVTDMNYYPSQFALASPRRGRIVANALNPHPHEKGKKKGTIADVCIKDKKRLSRIKTKPQEFPTSSYLKAISKGVSATALSDAVEVYNKNQNIIKNNKYITVIDFGLPASRKRFHVINVKTGDVFSTYTAHGRGSDRNYDGCVDVKKGKKAFSNKTGSYKSSEGFMLTGGFYGGKHGKSMRFHGLEKGKNDRACTRSIVAHGASYVPGGRSHGCPALLHSKKAKVYNMIGQGSLTYFYPGAPGKVCKKASRKFLAKRKKKRRWKKKKKWKKRKRRKQKRRRS